MTYAVNKYEAMMTTYDIYQENIKLIKELNSDVIALQEESRDAFSVARVIFKVINALIGLYRMAKEKIIRLFKIFSVRVKDVYMDNDKFLNKYGAKLNRISYANVSFDKGYKMDMSNVTSGSEVGVLTSYNFTDLKMIILDNKKVFTDDKNINYWVSQNRAAILGGTTYITNVHEIKDEDFKSELNNKYYGTRGPTTYSVSDAMNVIKNYRSMYNSVSNMKTIYETIANREIKELEKIKQIASSNSSSKKLFRTRDTGNTLVDQLSKLSQYRTATLNDSIIAYQVILQYIDDINLLAKSVCIQALREN